MRRLLWGLSLAALVGSGTAQGSELSGGPATPVRVVVPVKSPPVKEVGKEVVKEVVKPAEATCGRHGTTLEFVDTPSDAARQARKEGKLVFILHVSGHFEDPRFT